MKKYVLLSVALLGMGLTGVSYGAMMMDDTMTHSGTMMEDTMMKKDMMTGSGMMMDTMEMKDTMMTKDKMMMDEKMMKSKMMFEAAFSKMSDAKIKKISMRIDALKTKINASKISETKKAELLNKLWIIEEIIKEKMSMMMDAEMMK